MYYFKSLIGAPSSSSSNGSSNDIEFQRTLVRLSFRGQNACHEQYALFLSWLNPTYTLSTNPALIAALVACMNDPAGFANHKIACALLISKLDPAGNHAERVSGVLNALNTAEIKDLLYPILALFHHDLTKEQWDNIALKARAALESDNRDTVRNAIGILGILFSRSEEKQQDDILEILLDTIEKHGTQYSIIEGVIDTLGNLNNTTEPQREKIFKQFDALFHRYEVHIRRAIPKAFRTLSTQCYEPELQNLIIKLKENLNSPSGYYIAASLDALRMIFSNAEENERKAIADAVTPFLASTNIPTLDAALAASAVTFSEQDSKTKVLIYKAHLDKLNLNDNLLRETAAHGLSLIYIDASDLQQSEIYQGLEAALFKMDDEVKAAKALNALSVILPENIKEKVNAVLLSANTPSSKIAHKETLGSIPTAAPEVLERLKSNKDGTVMDQVIGFCAQTMLEVKPSDIGAAKRVARNNV